MTQLQWISRISYQLVASRLHVIIMLLLLELELELELEFYLFDRQLHNIGEIISKNMCEIIMSGDSHKGTNWPLA